MQLQQQQVAQEASTSLTHCHTCVAAAEDLMPLFPMGLIEQEVSTER